MRETVKAVRGDWAFSSVIAWSRWVRLTVREDLCVTRVSIRLVLA